MASFFLTREVAEMAVKDTIDVFLHAHAGGIVKRDHCGLVILDPTILYFPMRTKGEEWDRFITEAVLYIARAGDRNLWDHPYDLIALRKAWLTWKYRLPSRIIQSSYRYLLEEFDTIFGGSVIDEGGLIAGFSGVHPEHDEGFANMAMGFCKAYAQRFANAYEEQNPKKDFIGLMPLLPKGYDLSKYTGRYDDGERCPICDGRSIGTAPPRHGQNDVDALICGDCGFVGSDSDFQVPDQEEAA